MSEWIRSFLDLILIFCVGAGLVQATRLIKHLIDLRQGRVEMERFVHDFNATVMRAEAGIKGLRQAARESGDDLEKLVEKSQSVRDELQFIVETADQVAERLSKSASVVMRPEVKAEAKTAHAKMEAQPGPQVTSIVAKKNDLKDMPVPTSRAEKELLQALQKLS
jgi:hypothetical protein